MRFWSFLTRWAMSWGVGEEPAWLDPDDDDAAPAAEDEAARDGDDEARRGS